MAKIALLSILFLIVAFLSVSFVLASRDDIRVNLAVTEEISTNPTGKSTFINSASPREIIAIGQNDQTEIYHYFPGYFDSFQLEAGFKYTILSNF